MMADAQNKVYLDPNKKKPSFSPAHGYKPAMAKTLVALDLDGTLLDEASVLPAGHERVVAELRHQGIEVAIVTGRPLLTARWVHARLGLQTPMVCFNGGWLGYPGGEMVAACSLSEQDVRAIVAALADADGAICCYPDASTWIMDQEIPLTARWRSLYGAPITIDRARIHAWQGPSCKVMFVADPARLGLIAAQLHARFHGRFHVVVSQEDRFEVSPAGITKAWGLHRLAERLGVAQPEVWAVGDAANDLEMIRWAGHGCAMGQAPEAVRRAARHVLPGIHARGLCALPDLMA